MKKTNRRSSIAAGALALVFAAATTLLLAGPSPERGNIVPRISPPDSTAYGKTLTEWSSANLRWLINGSDPAQSKVGKVQFLPLPIDEVAGGSGAPDDPMVLMGEAAVILPPGAPFVLTAVAWTCERYEGYPAVADDPPMSDATFLAAIHPILTIDGQTVLSDANKAAFHITTTEFDPFIIYPGPSSYGSVVTVSFQCVSTVSPPLAVGQHVITLHLPFTVYPEDYVCANYPEGFGVVYEQTWNITVSPQ